MEGIKSKVGTGSPLRIVFLGTPDFAATCLETLLESRHEVVGVVTAPDRESGRGRKVNASAVKKLALKHDIPIAQPDRLRDEGFLEQLKSWNANLGIVVAFRMLPEVVWSMPHHGTVNLHASLLPQFRGAAPIQRAIMAGATTSGATTFLLTDKIDTGDILGRVTINIAQNENAGSLHDRILDAGKMLLFDTVEAISCSKTTPLPQSLEIENLKTTSTTTQLFEAPKLFKKDRVINWHNPSEKLHNQIRGLSPYPGAFTTLVGTTNSPLKILSGSPVVSEERLSIKGSFSPGSILQENGRLYVRTGDHWYEITRIQPSGKGAMDSSSFLRGLREPLSQFES